MAIVVPFGKAPAQRLPMPDETFTMAAAALMHENGRLVQRDDPKLEVQADANAKSDKKEPKP
jgi:hypothetical protein